MDHCFTLSDTYYNACDRMLRKLCKVLFIDTRANTVSHAHAYFQLRWRLSDEPLDEGESEDDFPVKRNKVKCTIFLGYTSNMISSGVREVIRYLAQHKMVCLTPCARCTTARQPCLMNT